MDALLSAKIFVIYEQTWKSSVKIYGTVKWKRHIAILQIFITSSGDQVGHTEDHVYVLIALVPSLLFSTYLFGQRVILLVSVCIAASMFFE